MELSVPCPVDGCITEALKLIRADACVEKHLLFRFGKEKQTGGHEPTNIAACYCAEMGRVFLRFEHDLKPTAIKVVVASRRTATNAIIDKGLTSIKLVDLNQRAFSDWMHAVQCGESAFPLPSCLDAMQDVADELSECRSQIEQRNLVVNKAHGNISLQDATTGLLQLSVFSIDVLNALFPTLQEIGQLEDGTAVPNGFLILQRGASVRVMHTSKCKVETTQFQGSVEPSTVEYDGEKMTCASNTLYHATLAQDLSEDDDEQIGNIIDATLVELFSEEEQDLDYSQLSCGDMQARLQQCHSECDKLSRDIPSKRAQCAAQLQKMEEQRKKLRTERDEWDALCATLI